MSYRALRRERVDYLRRRVLRWSVPLKWWLVYCLILSAAFYAVAAISTIALASVYGTWIEGNPITRTSFDNLGLKWGLIELGIIVIESIVVMMIFFLARKDSKEPFLLLFSAHFFLITSFFVSLNDFSYIASGGLGNILFLFRIFGAYPLNIFVFLILGFISTLALTTDRKNKETR